MISYLRGKIEYQATNWIILDVSGVGYKVFSSNTQHVTCNIGENGEFWIHHHIREDRQDLYGFKSIEELEMFELLLSVNGVGPKMAMVILSRTSLEKLKEAVSKGDISLLTAISRLGKKLASKIIIELKNKLAPKSDMILTEESQELVEALESLGYKKSEVQEFISKIPNDLKTIQDKIKWVLKNNKR